MSYYKWNRIFDSGVSSVGNSGILAVGHSGLLRPIENIYQKMNMQFYSCVPYFEGYLLITPGTLLYVNLEGKVSQNQLDLVLVDGTFINGMVILVTRDGKILYSKKPLVFEEYHKHLNNISRINKCDDKAIICSENSISIMWDSNNKIEFRQLATRYHHINAYLYDGKVITYSDDGYLNIYFIDSNFNILPNSLYRINISKNIPDTVINNIYIDHYTDTCDIYFLCDYGTLAVIPNFNYTSETIKDIHDSLVLYASKATASSHFTDMIRYKDEFIIVGHGEETNSCVKTKKLKDEIISHNIIKDITDAQRYMYNMSYTYESKYKEYNPDIKDLGVMTIVSAPVHIDDNGKYINVKDLDISKKYVVYVLKVFNSIKTQSLYGKVYVDTNSDKCDVLISISQSNLEVKSS